MTVHYGDSPTGQGTVLLLPGIGLSYRAYTKLIGRLRSANFRVVSPHVPDLARVVEKSNITVTLRTVGIVAARLLELIDPEQPMFVIGHSLGGGIATEMVASHPESFFGMILANSIGAPDDEGGRRSPLDWAFSFPSDLMVTRDLPGTVSSVTSDVIRMLGPDSQPLMSLAHAAQRADLTKPFRVVKRIGIPTFAIHSDMDRVIRFRSFKKMVELLGAESKVVPGAHGWMLTEVRSIDQVVIPEIEKMRVAAYRKASPNGSLSSGAIST
ncbi:MAG: alpha/beta hydrolase [Acidimicrobiaceae bacterium]|nr:alpha/beta hydrolase [Acidimicrobiaceae bacterium]